MITREAKKGFWNVEKNGYRERVLGIYQLMNDHLYFNRPDIEIKGDKYNSAILLSLLTALKQGKELIIGEPGFGKTTSAEFICSLMYQFPLGSFGEVRSRAIPSKQKKRLSADRTSEN